jgi:hypothetical protein
MFFHEKERGSPEFARMTYLSPRKLEIFIFCYHEVPCISSVMQEKSKTRKTDDAAKNQGRPAGMPAKIWLKKFTNNFYLS